MADTIRRFARDENAAVAFEAVIITPILAWLFVGSFIFFDAFRTYNTSVKATYAVADVISRQLDGDVLYGSDIEGLSYVFQHITRNTGGAAEIRVSEVSFWDGDYSVEWSHPTGGLTRLRDSDMPDVAPRIPTMVPGERVIVVETFLPYSPYFDIGLSDLEFTNFTVTRPRFAGRIAYDDGTDPACNGSCDFGEGDDTSTGGEGGEDDSSS